MKVLNKMYLLISISVLSLFAFAQVPVSQELVPVSEFELMNNILSFMGGVKTLAAGAIVLAVIQIIIMFIKTPIFGNIFKKIDAAGKFLLVQVLTVIAAYVGFTLAGIPTGEAIVKTLSLPMLQEFLYQIYVKYIKKS